MKYLYGVDEIAKRLPQRFPMLMIDRVLRFEKGREICCLKNVSGNEEYFQGHFPDRKIMPGVLIGEALAQTCALLGILDAEGIGTEEGPLATPVAKPEIAYLAAVNLKFLNVVVPGDQLLLRASVGKAVEGVRSFEVEAEVDRQPVCKGIISTTVRRRTQ